MPTLNAHALFVGANISPSYHRAIQLPGSTRRALRKADNSIRKVLRATAEALVQKGKQMQLATEQYRSVVQEPLKLEFRFLLQGGHAYDTAIEPALMPPQQSDRDVGIYVRTSFLSRTEPGLASRALFRLVEQALKPLCDKEGWTLVTDKASCVRIEISSQMHIDLPLYAIPDDAFNEFRESVEDATGLAFVTASENMLSLMEGSKALRIPSDRVMLAHRKQGWIASDPRALHDWFEAQFGRHGPQLRRLSRYLKGWRDQQFEAGGPSSVALMVCAANCFQMNAITADNDRDDLAFLQVAEQLPDMLRGDILNPVLEGHSKLNDWDQEERNQFTQKADSLVANMSSALNGTYVPELALGHVTRELGVRVPQRPDLIRVSGMSTSVRSTPAVVASSPLILSNKSTSG